MKRVALEEMDDQQHLRKKMAKETINVWTKWESSYPRCITVPITSTIGNFMKAAREKFGLHYPFADIIILRYEFVQRSDLVSTIIEGNSPKNPLKLFGGKLIKFDVQLSSEGKHFIFGDQFPKELRHKVYVRECYLSLFDILMEKFKSTPRTFRGSATRFTGTPGFGKSYFLLYVLYRLLLEKKDVFVSFGDNKFSFQSRDDGYLLVNKNPVAFSDNTIHLCDPDKYQHYSSSFQYTALFVSPSRSHMGPYSSTTVKNFIVPPWSENEVKECCDLLYGGYTHEYQEKFQKWGSSMRAILHSGNIYSTLLTSLRSAALPDHMKQFDQGLFVTDANETHQWVLFRWPDDQYQQKYVSFPSDYVKCLIGETLRKAQPDIMSTVPSDNILFGSIYEYFVREEFLCVGKNVNIGGKDYAIKKHIYFSSQDTFESITPESLYVPMEPDNEGVDFAYPPFLFQCSITAIPERSSVGKFISQFPNETGWKMFFIVPSQRKSVNHKVEQEELDNLIPFENLIYDFN